MNFPKSLVIIGLFFIMAGVFVWVAQKFPGLSRLGRLPGDIRIEGKNVRFFFPLVTCFLISLFLTLILAFFQGMKR